MLNISSSPRPLTALPEAELDGELSPRRERLTEDSTSEGLPTYQTASKWFPTLLGLLPMSLFAVFLVLLIVGLELFNQHVRSFLKSLEPSPSNFLQSPYNAPSSGIQFFWTYFPVALLMVVEWIWMAYDLQVKALVPWASMSRGFTSASEGWLLDYVGSNYFICLWTAIKYRHIVVLLVTLGIWCTAIAGIVTTSLFQLQSISHTVPRTLTRTTALDYSSFGLATLTDTTYLDSFLGRQTLGLSPSRWTTPENVVMEAFADSSSSSGSEILSANTRGYAADLNCTPASIAYAGSIPIPSTDAEFQESASSFLVNITGSECQATYNITDTNTVGNTGKYRTCSQC
jgi:hypothetical protein